MRSPRTQKPRSQQWPEYPQSSGSTSHTDIQTVPQKHKSEYPQTPRATSQSNMQDSPPNTKTKKPAVARVSAEFGVYLTHRHTDGPPKTQKKHYQGQPEYPQTPGSTSNTNMQERRKKGKNKIPVYRQVPQQKKRTNTKRQPECPQTPQSASEADIPESPKQGKGTLPKKETRAYQSRPKHPQTPGSTSKANIQDSNPAGAAALGGSP